MEDFETWEMSYFERGKMAMNNHLDSRFIMIEGRDAHEMLCFIPPKGPLTNQTHLENEQHGLYDPLDGNELNS